MADRPRWLVNWLKNPFSSSFQESTTERGTAIDSQRRIRPKASKNRPKGRRPIPEKPKSTIVIDGDTKQVIEEGSPDRDIHPPTGKGQVPSNLPSNLPEDVVILAAQNTAFLQGILALQKLNLDEDLFLDAIEDLRRQYYKERAHHLRQADQEHGGVAEADADQDRDGVAEADQDNRNRSDLSAHQK